MFYRTGKQWIIGNVAITDRDPSDEEKDIPDLHALLNHLIQTRQITKTDKEIIIATLGEGKSLKDIASTPADYERLKKRRQRILKTIRSHLANILK